MLLFRLTGRVLHVKGYDRCTCKKQLLAAIFQPALLDCHNVSHEAHENNYCITSIAIQSVMCYVKQVLFLRHFVKKPYYII